MKKLILGTKALCLLSAPAWAEGSNVGSIISSFNWSLIVPILLAIFGYSVQARLNRKNNIEINRREIEQSNRVSRQKALDRYFAEKRDTYFMFINAMDELHKTGIPIDDGLMKTFRSKLLFWGSVEALQAFDNMEKLTRDEPNGDMNMLLAVDSLYRAIRKDLGHDDGEGLKKGMLINMTLDVAGKNQVNEYVEKTNN
ncbi:MAG: hypothetical protein K8953_02860 [Proteobacteria bacterium]|nr:hypothetical protein [Pseudomonadota bacterium]